MADWNLIVGLGNPGAKYENTRHNIGFRAVEAYAQKYGLRFDKQEHKALIATGTVGSKRVMLAKPLTFMNLSGESVQPLMHFYKIEVPNLLVVCDDLDTPLGTLRMRPTGSSGGQNGLKSIIDRLGTPNVTRLRLGISRPPGRMNPADYVLQAFKGDDEILVVETIDRAIKAIDSWMTDGTELAMSRHNGPAAPLKQGQDETK